VQWGGLNEGGSGGRVNEHITEIFQPAVSALPVVQVDVVFGMCAVP
jgi:hypothetical protein